MEYLNLIIPHLWWVGPTLLLIVLPYFFIISLYSRLKKFKKAHKTLSFLMSGQNLDELLEKYTKEVSALNSKILESDKRLHSIETKLRSSVDTAELLRFNAFDNMGSDLSFALALLNQEGNGVVISSINSREDSRVYAKPIKDGKSTYHLSAEEVTVIQRATENKKI